MKKILFALIIIAAVFSGCSKSDDDTDNKSVCHFDAFRAANGNPQITYTTTDDGKRCKQIEYDCLVDTLQPHGPAHYGSTRETLILMTNFSADEIVIFEGINKILGGSQYPNYFTVKLSDGDRLYFDYVDERNNERTTIIKTKYQCVH